MKVMACKYRPIPMEKYSADLLQASAAPMTVMRAIYSWQEQPICFALGHTSATLAGSTVPARPPHLHHLVAVNCKVASGFSQGQTQRRQLQLMLLSSWPLRLTFAGQHTLFIICSIRGLCCCCCSLKKATWAPCAGGGIASAAQCLAPPQCKYTAKLQAAATQYAPGRRTVSHLALQHPPVVHYQGVMHCMTLLGFGVLRAAYRHRSVNCVSFVGLHCIVLYCDVQHFIRQPLASPHHELYAFASEQVESHITYYMLGNRCLRT